MTPAAQHRPVMDQLVMVAIIGPAPAETVLRDAFTEAERRNAAVRVVATGTATAEDEIHLREVVERWAEKYPDVQVTTHNRRQIDAAVTLVAATRSCAVAFVSMPSDPSSLWVLRALTRRAHCPLAVVTP